MELKQPVVYTRVCDGSSAFVSLSAMACHDASRDSTSENLSRVRIVWGWLLVVHSLPLAGEAFKVLLCQYGVDSRRVLVLVLGLQVG